MAWKAELGEANKQLVNVKLKHLEREKEWQNIEEQNVRLLEKRNMMVEHLREELMLQRQITADKECIPKEVSMECRVLRKSRSDPKQTKVHFLKTGC